MDHIHYLLDLEKERSSEEEGKYQIPLPWEEGTGSLPIDRQMARIVRLISARRVLREISGYYDRLLKEQVLSLGKNLSKKQIAINTNLIAFIAATDKNEDSLGHSQSVAAYTLLLAKALGIEDREFLYDLERGALLHDIGKIGIPDPILRKRGPLTVLEKEVVKDHPVFGHEIISEFEFLRSADCIVLYHHESFDGSGYPCGLKGREIPLEARIFALADTLDAITSDRPYRKGRGFDEAIREVEKCCGNQFDPEIAAAFLSISKEMWRKVKIGTQQGFHFSALQ
jgi:putative nucleotidyltransferase with HDIG domain